MNEQKKKLFEKGVSMLALVITIIVIIIIAAVIWMGSHGTIDSASRSMFYQELENVEDIVSGKRIDNQTDGITEEIRERGFYKSYVENPPAGFASFSDTSIYGYVVDLELIDYLDNHRGHDYERYKGDVEKNIVVFGKDDVYIYDANGKVYYAKGFEEDGTLIYSTESKKDGPRIVSVDKNTSADRKKVTLRIGVEKKGDGDLTVTVDGKEARYETEANGLQYFLFDVYENRRYDILAEEEGYGEDSTQIVVTEIDAETYTITYDANGGRNAPSPQIKTENVTMTITSSKPVKDGYTFLGWSNIKETDTAIYRAGGEYVLDGDATLYAVWQEGADRTFNVMYSANGGEGEPQAQLNVESPFTVSSVIPKRDGYGFDGWAKVPNAKEAEYHGGDKVTITENITLYAIWIKDTKTIKLNVNPEDAGTVTGEGARPQGARVTISTSANIGYVFKNWSVESGGVTLSNPTSSTTTFIMPNKDVVIRANYDISGLTVRYNANKGQGAPTAKTANYGETITVSSVVPTRAGYDFMGWALDPTATTASYHAGDSYLMTENVVFYAVWKVKVENVTVTYNLNGGTGDFPDQTTIKGGTITIYNKMPERLDWTFKGWTLVPNRFEGEAVHGEAIYQPGELYERTTSATLYAVWRDEKPPTLNLDVQQVGDETVLIATAHDEGVIDGYSWTKSSNTPATWSTDLGVGTKDLTTKLTLTEKGTHYIYVKDVAGNISSRSIEVYEVSYNANSGVGGPTKSQFKAKGYPLKLYAEKPTKVDYTFLGWSITGTNTDVYTSSATYTKDADLPLRAVWGPTFFTLSSYTGATQIDGAILNVQITRSEYTGTITITNSDTDVVNAKLNGDVLTVEPNIKIGTATITLVESREKSTKTYTVTVGKGIRKSSLNQTSKIFIYGDSSETYDITYRGKDVTCTASTSNSNVATATVSGKKLTVIPKNVGQATIKVTIPEDDQYITQTLEFSATVNKKDIIVTPDSNQQKVYDGTATTPTLTYKYTGQVTGETPDFTGELTRNAGSIVGTYEITLGSLQLIDNGRFLKSNYQIKLNTTKVYFSITPQPVNVPEAITGQVYDGTVKYGIVDNALYIRSADYAKIPAGNYTATVSLKDTHNYMWSSDKSNTPKNINWSITALTLEDGRITIANIPDQVYTAKPITPTITVRFNSTTLTLDTDYTVAYKDNLNTGTATVTVTGRGNYQGTKTTTFKIINANMTVTQDNYSGVYDNKEHQITLTPTWPSNGYTIYYSTEQPLTASNYSTAATTNPKFKDVTTTTVYFYIVAPNFNAYSGSRTVQISRRNISGATVSGISDVTFNGNNITQNIIITDSAIGYTLVNGVDYNIQYSDNLYPGTAKVAILATGNYTGSINKTFTIFGETINIYKDTEALVEQITVSLSKSINGVTTLQYSEDNSSWSNYSAPFVIYHDCTIFARTVFNGVVIGSNSLKITNICEHNFTQVSCTDNSYCIYCGKVNQYAWGHNFSYQDTSSTYMRTAANCITQATYWYRCANPRLHSFFIWGY